MNNQSKLSASNLRPAAINHDRVVATWTLPYGGGDMFLTERSDIVVAAHRAAGLDDARYMLWERQPEGNIVENSLCDTIQEAEDFVEAICHEIESAHSRDAYLDEIDDVRQQNIDDMFDKWLDKYEDVL